MSPARIKDGLDISVASVAAGGRIPDLNLGGVLIDFTGTDEGGHIRIVDKGQTQVDMDLLDSVVAEYLASTGKRYIFAGGVDMETVETALKSYEDKKLPTVKKF